jgi:hypothetical protein
MSKTFQRICACVLAILCMAGGAMAQSTTPIVPVAVHTSGMVGLTEGQTARLNVLNPGAPGPAATGAICSAQLSFLNNQGYVIKTTPVSVLPGKSISFNLDRDIDLAADRDQRVQIRATIGYPAVTPATSTSLPVCALLPTLEVFNNDTGRTQFIVGHFAAIPLPVIATPTN